jgi:hypothetical protein
MADADDDGSPLTSGSFQIKLGGKSSPCIAFDAFSLDIETALMAVDEVTDVDVDCPCGSTSNQFPYAYSIVFNTLPKNDMLPELSIDPYNFGKGDCDPFDGGLTHRGIAFPIKEQAVCTKAMPTTIIIAMKGENPEGTYYIHYRDKVSNGILVDGTAQDVEDEMLKLSDNFSMINVVKKVKYAGESSSAWIICYTTEDETRDEIMVNDKSVSGLTSLHIYPLLNITSVSERDDFAGDYRIQFGSQIINPISVRATDNKIITELLKVQVEIVESEDDHLL